MAMTNPGFEVVGGTETEAPKPDNGAAVRMLTLALAALSQRALIAIADMFSLITTASCFWLWWCIPSPNDRQIVALSLYGLLILAINWIVRRK